MTTLLVPCDGSVNALLAVKHAIGQGGPAAPLRIVLVNVQAPFSAHVSRHIDRPTREGFHRERGEQALRPARALLEAANVSYQARVEVGEAAGCIADVARRLRCERIVIGTARKSALVRAVENSLTNRLIECASVPVEVVTGAPAGIVERIGIPAGMGAGLALLVAS